MSDNYNLVDLHPQAFLGCDPTISRQDCTVDTCCLAQSFFLYKPDYAGNLFYAVFYTVLIFPQLVLGTKYRTWGLMVCMVLGLALEAIGYTARLGLHNDPFSHNSLLVYIILLTVAPVFITAAIDLCPSRIIVLYGEHLVPLKPSTIAISFMCTDVVSLILQAGGGAMTEKSVSEGDLGKAGINVMIAGLLVQAISLCVFAGVWAWFQLRVRTGVPDQDPSRVYTRRRPMFLAFTISLLLATIAIILRSMYRVVELWGGFTGRLWHDEMSFMVLDGAMVALAAILLTIQHPGPAFGEQWSAADWNLRTRKGRQGSEAASDLRSDQSGKELM